METLLQPEAPPSIAGGGAGVGGSGGRLSARAGEWGRAHTLRRLRRPTDTRTDGHTCASCRARPPARVQHSRGGAQTCVESRRPRGAQFPSRRRTCDPSPGVQEGVNRELQCSELWFGLGASCSPLPPSRVPVPGGGGVVAVRWGTGAPASWLGRGPPRVP